MFFGDTFPQSPRGDRGISLCFPVTYVGTVFLNASGWCDHHAESQTWRLAFSLLCWSKAPNFSDLQCCSVRVSKADVIPVRIRSDYKYKWSSGPLTPTTIEEAVYPWWLLAVSPLQKWGNFGGGAPRQGTSLLHMQALSSSQKPAHEYTCPHLVNLPVVKQ